jgi:hypothetical protein
MIIFICDNVYAAENNAEKISIQITAKLAVADVIKAGDFFCEYCEKAGGYYITKSDNGVSIRLPVAYNEKIESLLAENSILLEYSVNSVDIGSDYLTAVKQLNAREKLLLQYNNLAASADFSSTLSLERELMSVLREIESLKGRINKMENDYKFIKLDILFFSDNNKPPVKRISSFEWINSIDFYKFAAGWDYEN